MLQTVWRCIAATSKLAEVLTDQFLTTVVSLPLSAPNLVKNAPKEDVEISPLLLIIPEEVI